MAILAAGAEVQSQADFLDLKDPSKGALGQVSEFQMVQVLRAIEAFKANHALGPHPVLTAACGEWHEPGRTDVPPGVSMAKLGSAGYRQDPEKWSESWDQWNHSLPSGCLPVLVAYADWDCCDGACPETAIRLAKEKRTPFHPTSHVLIDTFDKKSPGLIELAGGWNVLKQWMDQAADHRVELVLAGKLTLKDLNRLAEMGAQIAGVRSAICQSQREGEIDPEKVKEILSRFR